MPVCRLSNWQTSPDLIRPDGSALAGGLIACASRVRFTAIHTFVAAILITVGLLAQPALALDPVDIGPNDDVIEITLLGEVFEGRGDQLEVETTPGADGIVSRMQVRAVTPGTDPGWVTFALRNTTGKPMERWLVAERYSIVGSGLLWPDLDADRITRVTPSIGFVPERIPNDQADIFRLNIAAGQTITFVSEISSERFPRLYIWKPLSFEKKLRDRTLFNGILLGITAILATFLTAIFAANHKAIFPVTALVAWSVLGYLCIDFGFWHKLFQVTPQHNAFYRAAFEAAIAASIVIFLFTFLRVSHWHAWIRSLFALWIIAQLSLVGAAFLDPALVATLVRASFAPIAGIGSIIILFLVLRGQDRALSLVPSWMLFLVWVFGAGVAIVGRLSGDIVVTGLVGGLVLILIMLGFTVTQFAFRTVEPIYGVAPNQLQARSLAIDSAGAGVWEWNARRDEINVSPLVESLLELNPGELSGRVDAWERHLHPSDRERFRLTLLSIQESGEGHINTEFRLRRSDSSYRWFELIGASVPNMENRSLRCVGLLRDVTDQKRSQERLIHDAVHDSLTGLPNRELFLDRLSICIGQSTEEGGRPTVLFIDLDRFKNVNNAFGLIVGDTMLLTVARKLARHLGTQDTLARIGGDQFAILLPKGLEPRDIAMLAERVRRSLRSPMKIAGKEIVLTGSIGISVYDGQQSDHADVLREAEIAMYRAKRHGADRIEIFKPSMRNEGDDRLTLENDLSHAIERRQIKVLYQPIVRLSNTELAGFEALVRWEHPQMGLLDPAEFIPIAEETDLIVALGRYVLETALGQAAQWQKILMRDEDPLYVSVNVSSRQLFRQNLVQEIRAILRREMVPKGGLKLEITESLVMENPEQAVEILGWLREAGAGLSMDDFGTGYSSLSYLQRFPFDTIKIDQYFVHDARVEGHGSAIVRSIVALAQELGHDVVAEGVELHDDVSFLRSTGCEFAQGYLFGEPMSEAEVLELLKVVKKSERSTERRSIFGGRFSWRANSQTAIGKSEKRGHPANPAANDRAGETGQMPQQQIAAEEARTPPNTRTDRVVTQNPAADYSSDPRRDSPQIPRSQPNAAQIGLHGYPPTGYPNGPNNPQPAGTPPSNTVPTRPLGYQSGGAQTPNQAQRVQTPEIDGSDPETVETVGHKKKHPATRS